MKLKTFFDNFEMLAEAPNGVQKLRELILQLAVRGKLVPQDEKDEPASILLEKIKVEKEQLINDEKIKNSQMLLPPKLTEHPYKLPIGWEWERLGTICTKLVDGSHNPPPNQEPGIPMLSSQNILDNEITFAVSRYISEEDYEKENERTSIENGDVFLTIVGTIGRSAVVPADMPQCSIQRSIALLRSGIFPYYLSIYLRSAIAHEYFDKYGKGTAQRGIYLRKVSLLHVPIPPLEEQHRIVAKVDQLMSLCDELEARQQKKRESRARLNSAALDRFLAARASGEFEQGWRRVCDNFDLLYDIPENVGALRQAILQLAVMGKLVPQNTNDEPASVLIEKIKIEKERLIKEKNINYSRELPKIDEDKVPYNLPKGWQWARLGNICHDWGQKKPDVEFTYIDVSAIDKEHGVISDNIKILKPNEAPSRARKIVSKGTVIYATVRPYLLNIAIIDKEIKPEPIVSTAFAVLYPFSGVLNRYLYYYLRSKPFIAYVESEMTGMAYPAINDGKLYMGLVPLPPSGEQRRIVAKLEHLMSLCNSLEASLERSQADGERLMEAVVGRMLAG